MKKNYNICANGLKTSRMNKTRNSINILYPYRIAEDQWVYDDEDLGVYKEAFVMGSSEVINHLVGMKCNKFKALISSSPIPEHTAKLNRIKKDGIEGWYQLEGTDMEHWLCGCVLDYFPKYPKEIYVKIEKL